jgi:UDP-4-amino-4-deoxy-L-arabinose formyltransferase/UDP-glucuronic acid dehydrogenase (UDP-4-keto-hexauronic acid decarboxylating)
MRFAALGRTAMFLEAIRAGARAGHQPVLIGTCAPSPEFGAGEADFQELAEELGCAFFSGTRIDPEMVRASGAEVAISFNWLTMIDAEVRDALAHGIVNAHPGDLPRYRGNACPNWAILNGETAIALTFHRMSDELDAGPMLAKRRLSIGDDTYIGDVYDFLRVALPAGFADVLDGLDACSLTVEDQPTDPRSSLRCYPRRPEDGLLDWTVPALQACRLVRASAEPFAGAFTFLELERVTVWRAHAEPLREPSLGVPGQVVERRPDGAVAVLCGDGLLVLEEVERDGERGPPAGFVRSLRQRFAGDAATIELARLRAGLRP